MKHPPHLMVAVSGHGYGHLAQCAPVINALRAQIPGLRLTLMSELPCTLLEQRLADEFTCLQYETDPVLRMHSAWEVDIPASRQVYDRFHRDWETALGNDVKRLQEIRPDLVLANIPYRLLSAAGQAGIPAVALCSLNWAAIYANYCGTEGRHSDILEQIWSGYHSAEIFLAPAPALPMPELDNVRAIGPIARKGVRGKEALLAQLSRPGTERIVLVALGGIDSELPLENWPRIDGLVWLFPVEVHLQRDDLIEMRNLSLPFIDVLASADAVLTKPGYGTYAEAVCNGVPILTLARPDWPETPFLNGWAQEHGCLRVITKEAFQSGAFADTLESLWCQPLPEPPVAEGITQAVDVLAGYLTCRT